jgi:glutamate decarboxylase
VLNRADRALGRHRTSLARAVAGAERQIGAVRSSSAHRVQQAAREVALHLSKRIAELGPFELITDGSELPVFAFALKPEIENYTVFDVSRMLREHGWLVPEYTFPQNRDDLAALRIVVRNGFTRDLADLLMADFQAVLEYLEQLSGPLPALPGEGFRH